MITLVIHMTYLKKDLFSIKRRLSPQEYHAIAYHSLHTVALSNIIKYVTSCNGGHCQRTKIAHSSNVT